MTLRPTTGASALPWSKSSYSTDDGPDCVEFAAAPGHVHVRDSKRTDLPHLTLTPGTWSAFVSYATGA
ncbi:DUF397 domain-containing protein [Streptomyces sp. SCSIO ZS0520]|uniref:DUF397 domain-containing protein n=1 Tax=Streptomyces sp. SCSIO ZS0520 TaxID=2892996 RepID=UPI0021DB14F6|nr:DUF397 domain-containing protein [Streptomyces sp. SCSIO ZS0520]